MKGHNALFYKKAFLLGVFQDSKPLYTLFFSSTSAPSLNLDLYIW